MANRQKILKSLGCSSALKYLKYFFNCFNENWYILAESWILFLVTITFAPVPASWSLTKSINTFLLLNLIWNLISLYKFCLIGMFTRDFRISGNKVLIWKNAQEIFVSLLWQCLFGLESSQMYDGIYVCKPDWLSSLPYRFPYRLWAIFFLPT